MNCLDVSDLLESLHDGALGDQIRRAVTDHLNSCDSCADELAKLRSITAHLQKSRDPVPSVYFDERVFESFRAWHMRRFPTRSWIPVQLRGSIRIPKLALAVSLLVFIVALGLAVGGGMMFSRPKLIHEEAARFQDNGPAQPEKIKVVEVPAIRKKIRTVYLYSRHQMSNEPNKTMRRRPNEIELAMSGSVTNKGYLTRANLSGFIPSTDMRTRVISNGNDYEK